MDDIKDPKEQKRLLTKHFHDLGGLTVFVGGRGCPVEVSVIKSRGDLTEDSTRKMFEDFTRHRPVIVVSVGFPPEKHKFQWNGKDFDTLLAEAPETGAHMNAPQLFN